LRVAYGKLPKVGPKKAASPRKEVAEGKEMLPSSKGQANGTGMTAGRDGQENMFGRAGRHQGARSPVRKFL